MKTIFVVDDDPNQAELLASVLTGDGRRIIVFSDAISAIAALASEAADLLIADVSMPWVDGLQIVKTARKYRPDLRIILVSGYPRGERVAKDWGVPFFSKPVHVDALCAAVEERLAPS